MANETLYDRLGQREGIRTVVDDFYDRLVADEDIGPFFEDADVERLRQTQTDFLCEAAGGPETYDAAPIREAHLHVPFTEEHIERAIEHLSDSLDAFDVPEDDAAKVVQAVAAYEEELLARADR
ncbi:group I truncated hemoglobin [Halobellus inordinatus]|uniref:group I truncated hemoglobin n=1 Tax=Halobellus inordinatus TaxID=1126236 RepID=UPI00210E04BE|nr:group 1 truncated hemoglobin [Halobellus inordinatus]